MTHGKRLSIDQYKADLSTVFRLGFVSERKCMGKNVSIYSLSIYSHLLYSTEKMKIAIFDVSYLRNPLTEELKNFLWSRVHLKMYQKKFEVSTISGTWLTRGLKMAKMAILLHLYITIAGKSDFLKFLILLLCCLYCVVVLFSMFLLGPRCPYPVLTLSRTN